jgi:predicted RNase H-like HicB family nuclease
MKARIVNIVVEEGRSGVFFATSLDMPNLMVAGQSREDVLAKLPAVIESLYFATGAKVVVSELENNSERDGVSGSLPWVVNYEARPS